MIAPWQAALAGGVVASGVLCVFLVLEKKRVLEARGAALEAAVASGEGRTQLAREAQQIARRLQAFAESYVPPLAERSADQHLARAYGLTPERLQSIDRLVSAFGG